MADDGRQGGTQAGSGAAANSVRVGTWTAVSRFTGFVRASVIAAVLGPTYLGNTYLATNMIPNLLFEFLTGSLLVAVLVPPLLRHTDRANVADARRIAGGFLGVALIGFTVIAIASVLFGPALLRILTLGVKDPAVAAEQREAGMLLLALVAPQVLLYAIAATGNAAMNARGRFSLAAAAPAFENVGVIVTLLVFAFSVGGSRDLADVSTTQLMVLGLGSTVAVGLHAVAQWWGAARAGIWLIPRAGWRDDEVREILRTLVPSVGYASLNALRVFATTVVANRVPGGVVAFRLALNLYYLPTAIAGRPVAVAALPELARHVRARAIGRAATELRSAASLALFLTTPAATAYLVLAQPLADAVSFGAMTDADGVRLVAVAIATLSVGVLGEAAFVMSTHAAYALDDARSPLSSMILRTVVTLACMAVAFALDDAVLVLAVLGTAVSAGNLVSAWDLNNRVRRRLSIDRPVWTPGLLRAGRASLVMAPFAWVTATVVSSAMPRAAGDVVAMVAATTVGAAVYFLFQMRYDVPEWQSVRSVVRDRGGVRPNQELA